MYYYYYVKLCIRSNQGILIIEKEKYLKDIMNTAENSAMMQYTKI